MALTVQTIRAWHRQRADAPESVSAQFSAEETAVLDRLVSEGVGTSRENVIRQAVRWYDDALQRHRVGKAIADHYLRLPATPPDGGRPFPGQGQRHRNDRGRAVVAQGELRSGPDAQAKTAVTPARRPSEETARLGDEIYERDIRPQVEAITTARTSPSQPNRRRSCRKHFSRITANPMHASRLDAQT